MRDGVRGLGREDDTRVAGVVGEKNVVAVELVGVCELSECVGGFFLVTGKCGVPRVREGIDV